MFIRLPALYLSLLAHAIVLGLSTLWVSNSAPLRGSKMVHITQLNLRGQSLSSISAGEPPTASKEPVVEQQPMPLPGPDKPVIVQEKPEAVVPAAKPLLAPKVQEQKINTKHKIAASISIPKQDKKTKPEPAVRHGFTAAAKPPKEQPQRSAKPIVPDRNSEQNLAASTPTTNVERDESGLLLRYRNRIQDIIESRKRYPRAARRQGLEGTTIVAFSVHRDGKLSEVALRKSSGHTRLDQSSRNTLNRIKRVDPIPAALQQDLLRFEVPLVYRLQ